jgi:hypothetical protein
MFAPNPIMGLYLEAISGDDKYIFKNMSCNDCGTAWTEEYRLAEISPVDDLPIAG